MFNKPEELLISINFNLENFDSFWTRFDFRIPNLISNLNIILYDLVNVNYELLSNKLQPLNTDIVIHKIELQLIQYKSNYNQFIQETLQNQKTLIEINEFIINNSEITKKTVNDIISNYNNFNRFI